MQLYKKGGTVQDKTLVVSGPANVAMQVFNNDAEKRYLQIFNASATDEVTLGTTTPTSVMVLPPSGGNTWDASWRTEVAKGCVIACTTTRNGSTLATAAADYEARY